MAFRIIADSSCDIFDLDRKIDGLYFNTVPFVITVDGRDFVDDDKLDVKELVEAMAASSKSHTSSMPFSQLFDLCSLKRGAG